MEREERPEALVERALVAIRRAQRRRALQHRAERSVTGDTWQVPVLDVAEEQQAADLDCTVSTVADRLGVDRPRASRLVARTVAAGLLRRSADQADGRRSLLTLTPAGRDQLDQVHGFRRSMVERAIAGWPDGDRTTFARLLDEFVRRWDELGTGNLEADGPR